jgi:hypothetical protein
VSQHSDPDDPLSPPAATELAGRKIRHGNMRSAIAIVIFFACLVAVACSSGGSTATPSTTLPALSPTPSSQATPPDTDCGLVPAPATTHAPGRVRSGWGEPAALLSDPEPSAAIIRGRVLHVVRTEQLLGFEETACIWVEQVIRGKEVTAAQTIVVNRPSPFAFEPAPFDNQIAFTEGVDSLFFLRKDARAANTTPVTPVDFYLDNYAGGFALEGPDAPSQQTIDGLLSATTTSYDAAELIQAELSRHHLESFASRTGYGYR